MEYEEIESEIVDETFRVGWPCLHQLPTEFERAETQEEYDRLVFDHNDAYATFYDVLASQSVNVLFVGLGWQFTRGAEEKHKTLRVIAQGKGSGKLWHHAALRLIRSAQEFSIDGSAIHVEIVERGFPRLLPVEQEDVACQAWTTSLAPKVMNILDQSSLLWQSLTLIRMGSASSADTIPTVLIEAAKITDLRWGPTKDVLQRAINEFPCKLQVWQMSQMESTANPNTDNLYPRMWGSLMSVGDGIAPDGLSNTTGTVGGFIKLEGDSSDYILTNFHVVSTDRMKSELGPKPLRSICLPKGSTKYPVKVPADFDTNVFIELRDKVIARGTRELNRKANEMPSVKERSEYGDKGAIARVEEHKKMEDEHKKLRSDIIRHAQHNSGNVRAVSGYQPLDVGGVKVASDWALVEMSASRQPRGGLRTNDVWHQTRSEIPPWVEEEEQKWTPFKTTTGVVFKLGRMTGWTSGRHNPAPAYWKALTKEDFQVEEWHDRYGMVVRCIQILPEVHDRNVLPFADSGDSGSVVRDGETGAWLGLLFGSHPREGWALATPIEAVFKNIEHVTGRKVVEPSAL